MQYECPAKRVAMPVVALLGMLFLCSCSTPPAPFHFWTVYGSFVHEDRLYYQINEESGCRRITGHDFMYEHWEYKYDYHIDFLVTYSLLERRIDDVRVIGYSADPRRVERTPAAIVGYQPNCFHPATNSPQGEGIHFGPGLVEAGVSGGREFYFQPNPDSYVLVTPERKQYTLTHAALGLAALSESVDLDRGKVYFLKCGPDFS